MNPKNRCRTPTLIAGLLGMLFYSAAPQAQLLADVAATSDLIPDQYIVVFKPDVTEDISVDIVLLAEMLVAAHDGTLLHTYQHALKGFAANFPAWAVAGIKLDPRVAYIEQDRRAYLDATQSNPPSWGLDRIDQRDLPLGSSYVYDSTGSGVTVYIIDSGIRITHEDFGGRATYGHDAFDGALPADDCLGHGTHVAGTVGGATYGVAKAVQLIAVRVFGCPADSSTYAIIIAGLDWVTGQKLANPSVPSVANMSLSGGAFQAMDDATTNAIATGIVVVVSAGNTNTDACQRSPARVAAAITVGATTITDARRFNSSIGTCLDLFAPGNGITSTSYTSDTGTAVLGGTSMAAPHVAGVAALYLQADSCASPAPATVSNAIINLATTGIVTDAGTGSPNRLLYSPLPTPATPSNFSVVPGGCYTGHYSSWSAAAYTSAYKLYRSRNGGSYVMRYSGCETSHEDGATFIPGEYLYKVQACNGTGCSAFTVEQAAVTPECND